MPRNYHVHFENVITKFKKSKINKLTRIKNSIEKMDKANLEPQIERKRHGIKIKPVEKRITSAEINHYKIERTEYNQRLIHEIVERTTGGKIKDVIDILKAIEPLNHEQKESIVKFIKDKDKEIIKKFNPSKINKLDPKQRESLITFLRTQERDINLVKKQIYVIVDFMINQGKLKKS